MKTLTLSLLLLALTACTANQTKVPAKAEEQKNQETKQVSDAQASSETQKGTPAQAAKNCICVKMWMPVCGTNKKTYGNSCEADCAGVKYKQGACEAKL